MPSAYWYATRGFGTTLLVVLTVIVVLGVLTTTRWAGTMTPGFVIRDLHRNLSLVALVLLGGHIATTLLDPFARIPVRDVLVPFGAAYRPVWLGLGVVAFWIMVAVALTSFARSWIGPRAWRALHWFAYAAWPLAVLHGVGTGSDSRAPWMIAVVAACVAAVVVAVGERIRDGRPSTMPLRMAAGVAAGAFLGFGANWAAHGPLQPGWAAQAGTPAADLAVPATSRAHSSAGFTDLLDGAVAVAPDGTVQISLRDMTDPALTITVRSPNRNETLPVVSVAREGLPLCTVPASAGNELYAVCGTTRMTIAFLGSSGQYVNGARVTARLETSGPLG